MSGAEMSETRDVCNRCGGTGAFLAMPLPMSGIRIWEPCPICSEEGEICRLQSRIEELERVLKPFADGLTYLDQMGSMRKEYLASISCTGKFGEAELIRARSVLEASNKGGK